MRRIDAEEIMYEVGRQLCSPSPELPTIFGIASLIGVPNAWYSVTGNNLDGYDIFVFM
jgi:hypothetical protein